MFWKRIILILKNFIFKHDIKIDLKKHNFYHETNFIIENDLLFVKNFNLKIILSMIIEK